MSPRVPLDIIFAILDELARPAPPLSYEFPKIIHKTLLSFLYVCSGTRHFASRMIYSRVCVESVAQLDMLCRAPDTSLATISSLYVRLDEAKKEIRESVNPAGIRRDHRGRDANLVAARMKESYDDLTTKLCRVLRCAQPNLVRLAIGLPRTWNPEYLCRYNYDEPDLGALEALWAGLRVPLSAAQPNLVELAFLNPASIKDYFSAGATEQDWSQLRRLGLCSEMDPLLPSMPSVERICFCYMARRMSLMMEACGSLRKAFFFFEGRPLWQLEGPERWAQRQKRPIEVVLVEKDRCWDVWKELPPLIRSGRLWDSKRENFPHRRQ